MHCCKIAAFELVMLHHLFEEQCLTDAYAYVYIATHTATQYLMIYCAHNMTHKCKMDVCNHTLHAQVLTADVLLTGCRF